jgi:hypothetical protein
MEERVKAKNRNFKWWFLASATALSMLSLRCSGSPPTGTADCKDQAPRCVDRLAVTYNSFYQECGYRVKTTAECQCIEGQFRQCNYDGGSLNGVDRCVNRDAGVDSGTKWAEVCQGLR